jgi:hypothetical protein
MVAQNDTGAPGAAKLVGELFFLGEGIQRGSPRAARLIREAARQLEAEVLEYLERRTAQRPVLRLVPKK